MITVAGGLIGVVVVAGGAMLMTRARRVRDRMLEAIGDRKPGILATGYAIWSIRLAGLALMLMGVMIFLGVANSCGVWSPQANASKSDVVPAAVAAQ